MNYELIPENTRLEIDRYASEGVPPGEFVGALLEADVARAAALASPEQLAVLLRTLCYFRNTIPDLCWGSPGRVQRWLAAHSERMAR